MSSFCACCSAEMLVSFTSLAGGVDCASVAVRFLVKAPNLHLNHSLPCKSISFATRLSPEKGAGALYRAGMPRAVGYSADLSAFRYFFAQCSSHKLFRIRGFRQPSSVHVR